MATILIHFFTGTGNTAHAVKLISDRLHASGHDVSTLQVKKNVEPPAKVFDYHIIAFPVLSWSAPVSNHWKSNISWIRINFYICNLKR